ncbi:hypothetical protein [Roseateles sp.]|uniref:hypothetical protein n=1 Tax=Roseateles sp. TaxID=1971397 RepID=UPI003BAA2D9A
MRKNRDYTGLERTPASLAWLIKERASVRGLLEKRKKQLTSLPLEICDLLDRMTSLDSVIRLHEVNLEPSAIEGKRTYEARVYPNRRLKPSILRFLKEAKGSPLYTSEVMFSVVKAFGMDVADYSLPQLKEPVRKVLQKLALEGKVVRHHDLVSPTEGRWSMKPFED